MNTQLFSLVYGAALHIAALISLVVLVAIGKVSWADGGPIIGGLIGVGVGVPLTFVATKAPDPTPVPVVVEPAPPIAPATV